MQSLEEEAASVAGSLSFSKGILLRSFSCLLLCNSACFLFKKSRVFIDDVLSLTLGESGLSGGSLAGIGISILIKSKFVIKAQNASNYDKQLSLKT